MLLFLSLSLQGSATSAHMRFWVSAATQGRRITTSTPSSAQRHSNTCSVATWVSVTGPHKSLLFGAMAHKPLGAEARLPAMGGNGVFKLYYSCAQSFALATPEDGRGHAICSTLIHDKRSLLPLRQQACPKPANFCWSRLMP